MAMAENTVKQADAALLTRAFGLLASSLGENLGSLIGRDLTIRPGEIELHDPQALVRALPRPYLITRGSICVGGVTKTLFAAIEVPDVVAMIGGLMMTPEDDIAERRKKNSLEPDDRTAFEELGKVMYSGFGTALRDMLGDAEASYTDNCIAMPGDENCDMLGHGTFATLWFRMKLGEYPESRGYVGIDRATAEVWNKEPLVVGEAASASAVTASSTREDDALEQIEAAPIRGILAAYVLQSEVYGLLRMSCRRVGLDLQRHSRAEVPNPMAHKNDIVLMDVPTGEERRFDWCRRIKEMSNTTRVVLLIHHPSRQRVTQAFLSRADAILGLPCDETQLSLKLASMCTDSPSEPPIP
jgi:CheY-like chemotaxis protein